MNNDSYKNEGPLADLKGPLTGVNETREQSAADTLVEGRYSNERLIKPVGLEPDIAASPSSLHSS